MKHFYGKFDKNIETVDSLIEVKRYNKVCLAKFKESNDQLYKMKLELFRVSEKEKMLEAKIEYLTKGLNGRSANDYLLSEQGVLFSIQNETNEKVIT